MDRTATDLLLVPPVFEPSLPSVPEAGIEQTDLRELIAHSTSVRHDLTVEQVYDLFATHPFEFMAVSATDGSLIGMCARREIGMLLGSRYGFSLFARRPVRDYLCKESMRIPLTMPVSRVLQQVFSRDDATFYDDVLLVDSAGHFLGLISTQSLVRLENRFLLENIHRLEQQGRVINAKNEQMEADLCMARELQQAMLPAEYPTFPPGAAPEASAIQFVHRYQPSGNVGGDFFHLVRLSDQAVGVFICDVMGHGVRSALVTAMLRALVEEIAPSAPDPGALMTTMNRELTKILQQTGAVLFATALYAVVDAGSCEMRYAIAGHPFPVHVRRSLQAAEALAARERRPGPALGLFPSAAYDTRTVAMSPGDLMVIYTDGLFEVDNPTDEEFGESRILQSLSRSHDRASAAMVEDLFSEIETFSAGRGFADDVCLVGLELHCRCES